MKEFIQKNYLVIVALSLPFLFIMGVVMVVSLQTSAVQTEYSFVYATCDQSSFRGDCHRLAERYVVNDGVLEVRPVFESVGTSTVEVANFPTRLFIHEMPENSSREVLLADVAAYEISPLLSSPDGYEVVSRQQSSQGVFPFMHVSSQYNYYLVKNSAQLKLNLSNQVSQRFYAPNFHFIGWIIN